MIRYSTAVRVVLAGMHRSGTSMVTRLLNLCGLGLGDPDALIAPAADNPGGFWEHREFVGLNDRILAALDGGWNNPPLVLADRPWDQPALAPLRDDARHLLASFAPRSAWGWKDPRNALTLGFWMELIPDLHLVVCLRDPDAVAGSMAKRNQHVPAYSLSLLRAYLDALAVSAPRDRTVVTHYDAYFVDPYAELARVCEGVGLTPTATEIASAVATIRPDLRHHQQTTTVGVPADVTASYQTWCERAGPVFARVRTAPPGPSPVVGSALEPALLRVRIERLSAAVRHLDRDYATASGDLAATRAEVQTAATRAAESAESIAELTRTVVDSTRTIAERDEALTTAAMRWNDAQQTIVRQDVTARRLAIDLQQVRKQEALARAEIDRLISGRLWKLMTQVWNWRLRIAPRGSRLARWLGLEAPAAFSGEVRRPARPATVDRGPAS